MNQALHPLRGAIDVAQVEGAEGVDDLGGEDTVSECGDLLIRAEFVRRVGDPRAREAREPFHELRRRSWPCGLVQEGWCGGGSAGHVFPSGDGVGVASPASKMLSIRFHSVADSYC